MSARFQKVQGHSNLMRDKHTGAVLNMDKSGIEQSRKAKNSRIKQEQRIEKLEQDIGDIKNLLASLAEKL
jgi:uncharacterized FlaG/YvyC family protein